MTSKLRHLFNRLINRAKTEDVLFPLRRKIPGEWIVRLPSDDRALLRSLTATDINDRVEPTREQCLCQDNRQKCQTPLKQEIDQRLDSKNELNKI